MIDHELRRRLSQDLRRLVTGRITNDAFDDAYYHHYRATSDRAVAELSEFGWTLYSSDVLIPYRLKGRHAVSKQTRRDVARCVLFLNSGHEYEWPNEPSQCSALFRGTLAFYGVPIGIALSICSIPLIVGGVPDVEFLWPVAAFGLVILFLSTWYIANGFAAEYNSPSWRAWRSSGDFDVWPFLRREDFYKARRTAFLFGRAECSEPQR